MAAACAASPSGSPRGFDASAINLLDPGSQCWVLVTHINNPHSFYVMLLEHSLHLELIEGITRALSPVELELRNVVVYPSRHLKKNIRGQVYNMQHYGNHIVCDMVAIDYGFTEKGVTSMELYKPKCDLVIPPLAIHCRLANCEPAGGAWVPEATDAMRYYCRENERTKMTVISKSFDCLSVDLINSCPDDISTMLAYSGYSTLGYNGNNVNRLNAPKPAPDYYNHKKLTPNTSMQVRLQYGKVMETFFVADPVEYQQYLTERNMLTTRMHNERYLKAEEFVDGAAVAVRMDGIIQYERGLILKITVPMCKALVQLMDWGTVKEFPVQSLRPIPEIFLQKPVMAMYCCLDRKTMPDLRLRRFLSPGYQLNIKVIEAGDGFRKPNVVSITSI